MVRDEQTAFHLQVQSSDQKRQTHRPLYKELSDLTESTSLTVTKVLQSLIPLTP